MKILMAGGHGFIGTALKGFLQTKGHEVVCLTRHPDQQEPFWNPEKEILDLSLVDWSDVVINLCGESVFGLWTQRKVDRFKRSRLIPAITLCSKIEQAIHKPKLYISASAIGYYGDGGDCLLDEKSPKGEGFFADLVEEWEGIADPLTAFNVRTVFFRFGIVLGKKGGALKSMLPAFKSGLGGKLGDGKQWMSWIELQDVLNAVDFAINNPHLKGAVNCVSPQPVTNAIFTKSLGQILHAPTHFTVPKWVLKLVFKEAASLFLGSQKVKPKKLLEHGFQFQFPEIVGALRATCRKEKVRAAYPKGKD
jgi:uncharacterized protein